MSDPDPAQLRRRVEPVPYAHAATPRDALLTGPASRALLVGGIMLRLIGAYSLVECRPPFTRVLENAYLYFGNIDLNVGWTFLILAAYIAWGLLLVIRGPRFVISALRRVPEVSSAGGEWSVAAICAAGAIIILWTMEPLLGVFSNRWVAGAFVTTLAQLALGAWLFLASGRLSRLGAPADRR
jgi:hypothetical protein